MSLRWVTQKSPVRGKRPQMAPVLHLLSYSFGLFKRTGLPLKREFEPVGSTNGTQRQAASG
jgi:hypothetical protein